MAPWNLLVFLCACGSPAVTPTAPSAPAPLEPAPPSPAPKPLSDLELSVPGRKVIDALGVSTVAELVALKQSEYLAAARKVDEGSAPKALREISALLADMGEHFAPEGELVEREGDQPTTTAPTDGLVAHVGGDGRYQLLLLDQPAEDEGRFPDPDHWSWKQGDVRVSVQVRPIGDDFDAERLTGIRYTEATLLRGDWGMLGEGREERSCFTNLYVARLGLVAYARARGSASADAPDDATCADVRRLALSLTAP